uniref:Uncharacterized protein n=1 Tax=Sphaerodactylus townsendi TaxID=933632 RepID=A0ACB8FLB3_9SAUR
MSFLIFCTRLRATEEKLGAVLCSAVSESSAFGEGLGGEVIFCFTGGAVCSGASLPQGTPNAFAATSEANERKRRHSRHPNARVKETSLVAKQVASESLKESF